MSETRHSSSSIAPSNPGEKAQTSPLLLHLRKMAMFTRSPLQQQRLSSSSNRGAAFTSTRPAVQQRRSSVAVRADGAAAAPAAAAKASGIEKSMTALKPVLDIEAIKGVLPHR